MSQSLSDIHSSLKQALEGYGILDIFPAECDGQDSILDDEVEIVPVWRIREERQARGTGVPVDLGVGSAEEEAEEEGYDCFFHWFYVFWVTIRIASLVRCSAFVVSSYYES